MNKPILKGLLSLSVDTRLDTIEEIVISHKELLPLLGFTLEDKDQEVRAQSIVGLHESSFWEIIDDKELVDILIEAIIRKLIDSSWIARKAAIEFIKDVDRTIWYPTVQKYYNEGYNIIPLAVGLIFRFKDLPFDWNRIIKNIREYEDDLYPTQLYILGEAIKLLEEYGLLHST